MSENSFYQVGQKDRLNS